MEDNEIFFDFRQTDYSDAAVRNDSELVNKVQMKKMMELVDGQINKSREFKLPDNNKFDNQHVHNTISIFGNRGAGKTTFLQTTLDKIARLYGKEVVLLKVLDPSLLDCKQHPFISIIASIHELVEECINKDYLNRGDISKTDKDKYDSSYKSLLKGLPFIDGVGSVNGYQDWDDDLYVSMQGMEKAEASNNLIDNFIKYVYNALEVLDKKCFIISFDDIDTNINKGFEILEVIRKYLITEQIITILTGDLDLYSKLVRKASWDSFSKNFLEKECDYSKRNPDEFSHMINHLENQYLLKVLKPENRIHLKTIREVIESKNSDIIVKFNSGNNRLTINDCYESILNRIGFEINNIRVTNQIIYFLEGLSIRTQMRLLKLLSNCYNNEQLFNKNIFTHEFINIFWTDIKQKSLDAKSLVNDDSYYPVEMMKFLIDTKSLSDCSDFMPHTNDDILNKALLAISAQFTKQVNKSAFMIFDYWVRVCYLKYVVESFKVEDNINMLDEVVKFSSILEHDDLTKCVGLVEAYSRSIYKSNLFPYKTIPGTIIINEVIENDNDGNSKLLDIISHGTINQSNDLVRLVSLYKLFAVIRDFLFHISFGGKTVGYINVTMLRKISQFRGYLEPLYSKDVYNVKLENNDFEEKELPSYEKVMSSKWYEISKEMIEWSSKFNNDYDIHNISPQLLNRIFTRTYFTMINIDQDSSYVNLGQKLNAYIIAFLNSVLVESYFDNHTPNDIIIDNMGKIENIFKFNIAMIKNGHRSNRLLRWFMECPLLNLFINPVYFRILKGYEAKIGKDHLYNIYYNERELYFKIKSLHKMLDEYNLLSENLIKAIKWTEDLKMKTIDKDSYPKFIFSLKPLENGIMYLDINMSNNLIFQKIDKMSTMLEKVGALIYSIEKEIKNSEMYYSEVFDSKREKLEILKQENLNEIDDSFYRYLCNIRIK